MIIDKLKDTIESDSGPAGVSVGGTISLPASFVSDSLRFTFNSGMLTSNKCIFL
jgi:hypothetical protein